MKIYVFVFVIAHFTISVLSRGLTERFTWTRINYAWPSARTQRQTGHYAGSGIHRIKFPGYHDYGNNYVRPNRDNYQNTATQNSQQSNQNSGPGNVDYDYVTNIPMGANKWKNKLFITVPRRRLGVPSTLNYVPVDSPNTHNVPLIPYPNWEINLLPPENERSNQNQIHLTSVYRVAVDPCDRLWVIDTGLIELPGNATRIQPSQLIIFDLNTDRVIQRYQVPQSQMREATNLAIVTVDVTKDKCNEAYAYIPDVGGYGLVVYSLRDNRSWRVTHNYFFLESTAGEFKIAGFDFQWNDGIFSLALSGIKPDGYRDAYFHPMAGTHLYSVSTRVLRNESLATRSYHGDDFKIVGDRGPLSQTSASDMYQQGAVLFLGMVNMDALGCWNTNKPLYDLEVIYQDKDKMVYPCDVKVHGEELILLTNRMPQFLYGQLDYDQVNFRVWIDNVGAVTSGTNCENRRSGINRPNFAGSHY